MKNKSMKERLTRDVIAIDLKQRAKGVIPHAIEGISAPVIVFLMWYWLYYLMQRDNTPLPFRYLYLLTGIVIIIHSLIASVYSIKILRKELHERKQRQNGEFDIAIDKLVPTVVASHYRVKRRKLSYVQDYLLSLHERQTMMTFAQYGEYWLPRGNNYRWSKLYCMSNEGVHNTSLDSDTFYVVIYRNDPTQTPVMVYNTRLFELQDSLVDNDKYIDMM